MGAQSLLIEPVTIKPFTLEHDRLQHLFERYQAMKKLLV
jgi:hypothetical protein|tara:strand:- start:301 stop:417 length:117 start_codon:yes stop_codon:yes gene_type:complete